MSGDDRPALLIAESSDFCAEAAALLKEHFRAEFADLDGEELLQRVATCEYLWVRLRHRIDARVFDAAPKLRAIITNTTGLNHIDTDEASRRGIEVISLRGETEFLRTIRATAELTIGLTLALLRKVPAAHAQVCAGLWNRDRFRGQEIFGKTVGIVGYGRLGQLVAEYFAAFGARVVVHDRRLVIGDSVDGHAICGLMELLSASDIVSVHLSYEPDNRHFFAAIEFQTMKPSAVFINTARGELVDESALLAALESGRLAGAALDVVESEHQATPNRARLVRFACSSDRLVLTPHIGGNTYESTARTEMFLSEKLVRLVRAHATS